MMANFDLFETMGFDPKSGIARLELHLMRMKDSANILGFNFDRHEARNQLHAAIFTADSPAKIRLMLSPSGALSIEVSMAPPPRDIVKAGVVLMDADHDDVRLAHKTTDRGIYDMPRLAHPNWDEVIFVDKERYLTEGSISSIFVKRGDIYVTPPKSRGLIPGILRQEMIDNGMAIEGDLMEKDLLDGFFVGNSLRGLTKAQLIFNPLA